MHTYKAKKQRSEEAKKRRSKSVTKDTKKAQKKKNNFINNQLMKIKIKEESANILLLIKNLINKRINSKSTCKLKFTSKRKMFDY
jgi:hypothetical protein